MCAGILESETAVTCWAAALSGWPPFIPLTQHGSLAGQLMASYSSDEDPSLRGDFTMDTDFDFELPVRCGQGTAAPRNMFNLTTGLVAAGESKKRGKGEGGRGGGGGAKPPAKEKVQRPSLDIHTAALVGESVGTGSISPNTGGDSKILCRICGDSAVRHVHYGGHCCFSCKAFFRYNTSPVSY